MSQTFYTLQTDDSGEVFAVREVEAGSGWNAITGVSDSLHYDVFEAAKEGDVEFYEDRDLLFWALQNLRPYRG